MERCIFEAFAKVRRVAGSWEWVAEAYLGSGTVRTMRFSTRAGAVEWANSRVREHVRYWEDVRRDADPTVVRIHNRDLSVDDVPAYLHIMYDEPGMSGWAVVMLRGYDGCLAVFAYEGAFFERPHGAAMERAEEWLRHGK